MINEEALRAYVRGKFDGVQDVSITKLGSGVQGAGFLIRLATAEAERSYVVKALLPEGFGHDYPSDRAAVFLLDLDEYGNLERHVRAVDVLAELPGGRIRSIGGGIEYYLMMETAEGRDYFHDLRDMAEKKTLGARDRRRISALAAYLAGIHAVRKESKPLYWRKLRDTVGHGECLMGVFDIYPDGTVPYGVMTDIIRKAVDAVYRLKPKHRRLCQIHGDFHPGNIWFRNEEEFVLLDRSRGPWGEAADDVTALAINYLFFSIKTFGDYRAAYREAFDLFLAEYVNRTADTELFDVAAPFFAFRSAVVANPVFYPELSGQGRMRILSFAANVLAAERFDPARIDDYLSVSSGLSQIQER